jgi:alpha-tubulin suppressor-like RCC1 family protein
MFCWGANTYGQVGDGTSENRLVPVAVSPDLDFVRVRAGNHACALTISDAAYCWGQGTSGQLGNGATESSPVPIPVAGDIAFVTIEVGGPTCGLSGTQAYCWGANDVGQLGTGDLANYSFPTAAANGLVLSDIAVGGRTGCAITGDPDYAVVCWGDGQHGELGNGSFGVNSNVPVSVLGGGGYFWLYLGGSSDGPGSVCGSTSEGGTFLNFCWGSNAYGQLGDGTTTDRSSPVAISGGVEFGEIVIGQSHACGRADGGVIYCWGAAGLLGTGNNSASLTPVPVSGGLRFATITAGARHTCGRTEVTNVLYCWGANDFGQLGDGTTLHRLTPVKVSGQS